MRQEGAIEGRRSFCRFSIPRPRNPKEREGSDMWSNSVDVPILQQTRKR